MHIKKGKIQNANPNISVLEEYRRCEIEFVSCAKNLEEITSKCDESKIEYDSLRKKRLEEFMHGFTLISQKFKKIYQVFIGIISGRNLINLIIIYLKLYYYR